ncbi:MAG: MFS transporter [Candidatus Hydrogenedentota bacterium]
MNRKILFIASCVALAATSMSFAIRGDIMGDFENQFVVPYVGVQDEELEVLDEEGVAAVEDPVKSYLGIISGAAFFTFGLAILFGGPLCDLLGMGRLLRLAAVCHIGGTALTIFAPNFWVVVAATFIIGAANGLVEAVCNPLIATIYPDQKAKRLMIFHAWFPGGIVIGGLFAFLFTKIGQSLPEEGYEWLLPLLGWQGKMALLLIPSVIYTVMIFAQEFPPTERVASGVSTGDMFKEAAMRPLFLLILVMMLFTAATELGVGQWIANIYNDVMSQLGTGDATAGVLLLVWGSGLMFVLRQFGSNVVHKLSPVGVIAGTAPFAAVGLWICSTAASPILWFVGSGLMYFGFCFWWPAMLGITAERFPKTGALGLAVVGAAGAFSTWIAGPVMGYLNDNYGPTQLLRIWIVLPALILVVFGILYFSDMSRGGYKKLIERLDSGIAPENNEG